MRKLVIVAIAVITLVVIGVLVAPAFMNVDKYHDRIQAELSSKLGRSVTVGKLHVRFLPVVFGVEDVTIAEDPQFETGRPFVRANELTVSPKILPMLHGEIVIRRIDLQQPVVEIVRHQGGAWNFSTLGKTAPQQRQQKSELMIGALNINDGQIAITDQQKRLTRVVYDHIDLTLSNFAPDHQFAIALAAHLAGGGNQLLKLEATVGPLQQSNMMMTPFDGTLKLDEVSLAGLKKFANLQQLAGIDAMLTGEMTVKNASGVVASSGNLKADQVSLHGTQIGYPVSANYKMSDDLNNDVIRIEGANLQLGSTPVDISGSVDAKPSPAQLDLRVRTTEASLTEAARLAAAAGVAFSPGITVQGRVTGDVTAKGRSNQPYLNGQFTAHDLVISGKDLPQAVAIKQIAFTMTPQSIQSNNFNVASGGTNLNGRFTLTQYASTQPAIDATLQAANANVEELFSMAKAYGLKATEGLTGSGLIDLNVHLAGPVKNANALNFTGNGKLANAQIKTATMTKPLVVRSASLQFTQNTVVVQNLAASLGSTNATGEATVRNFAAPNVQFTLAADKVNVAELEDVMGSKETPKTAKSNGFSLELVPRAEAAPIAPSPLINATGGGNVTIGNVIYDQLQLQTVKSPVTLDHGMIRLSPLTAQVYGGTENGSVIIDTRSAPSTINVTSSLQKVDANKLISSVTSAKQVLYGLLAANTNTHFSIPANGGADAIARSLNGTLAVDLTNGKIANMDLLYQLASIGKFLNGQTQQKPATDLLKLVGNFNVVNGVATTDNLKATLAEGASLAAAGTINLVNEGLNLHLTAVLPRTLSQTVGGTNIGGLMQTALANRNGELIVPVLVTGSFSSPQFAPDLESVARMKLNNLLPTAQNPGQLTTGLLGGLLGNGQGQQNPLGNVVGAITGQQSNQQKQQPPVQGQQSLPSSDQPPPQNDLSNLLGSVLNKNKKPQQKQQPPPKPPEK